MAPDTLYPDVTILTLWAGKFATLEPVLYGINNLDYPREKIYLLWITNCPSKLFQTTLKEAASQWTKTIPQAPTPVVLVSDRPHTYETTAADLSGERASEQIPVNLDAIADLYNDALKSCGTKYLLSIEDDEVVPSHTLKKLLSHMEGNTAVVSGTAPSRHSGEMMAYQFNTFEYRESRNEDGTPKSYIVLLKHQRPFGVKTASGAGIGCALLDVEQIRDAIPDPIFKTKHPQAVNLLGSDTILYYDLIAKGKECKVDYDVRPYHLKPSLVYL